MFTISTFCLHRVSLTGALNQLTAITDHIEIIDEGLHHLKNADILRNYSAWYTIHAPSRCTNLASLLEPIRQASVEVIAE